MRDDASNEVLLSHVDVWQEIACAPIAGLVSDGSPSRDEDTAVMASSAPCPFASAETDARRDRHVASRPGTEPIRR